MQRQWGTRMFRTHNRNAHAAAGAPAEIARANGRWSSNADEHYLRTMQQGIRHDYAHKAADTPFASSCLRTGRAYPASKDKDTQDKEPQEPASKKARTSGVSGDSLQALCSASVPESEREEDSDSDWFPEIGDLVEFGDEGQQGHVLEVVTHDDLGEVVSVQVQGQSSKEVIEADLCSLVKQRDWAGL